MHIALRGLMLGLSLVLVACGPSDENSAAPQVQSASTDPKYQNPLLNIPPAEFATLLADCGEILYGKTATPNDAKCRGEIIERASKQNITLTDGNLDEPLVHDRYQFGAGSSEK